MTRFTVNLTLKPIKVDADNASAAVSQAIEKLKGDADGQVQMVSAAPDPQRDVGFQGTADGS